MADLSMTRENLLQFTQGKKYNTIYADPPWQFQNRTGKVAPETAAKVIRDAIYHILEERGEPI